MRHVFRAISRLSFVFVAVIFTIGFSWAACMGVAILYQASIGKSSNYQDIESLYWVRSDIGSQKINPDLIRELSDHQFTSISDFCGYGRAMKVSLRYQDSPITWVDAAVVTPNVFEVFQVAGITGRGFSKADGAIGGEANIIISYKIWASSFGGDPSIVGKIVDLNGYFVRVIGILPREYKGPSSTEDLDVYIPIAHYYALYDGDLYSNINYHMMTGVIRLESPTKLSEASGELNSYFNGYVEKRPAKQKINPVIFDWKNDTLTQKREMLRLYRILGVVLGALFLGSLANVAIVSVLRVVQRSQEIATKIAIGASRLKLILEFGKEAVILWGGALLIATFALPVLLWGACRYVLDGVLLRDLMVLDWVLFHVFVIGSCAQLLILILVPLFMVGGINIIESLRSTRTVSQKSKLLPILSVGQVGVMTAMTIASVHLGYSAYRLSNSSLGYSADNVLTLTYGFKHIRTEVENQNDVRNKIKNVIEEIPEAVNVANGSLNFLNPTHSVNFYFDDQLIDDQRQGENTASQIWSGPGLLNLMGISIISGRDFSINDQYGSEPVIMVNREFVEAYFGGDDPINKQIRIYSHSAPLSRIIGVAEDFLVSIEKKSTPVIFLLLQQQGIPYGIFSVKTIGPESVVKQRLDKLMTEKLPEIGVPGFELATDLLWESSRDVRDASLIVTGTALLALVLSLLGLHLVFAFEATIRVKEYLIRIAMGATRRKILMLAGKGVLSVTLMGIALGSGVEWILVRPFISTFMDNQDMPDFHWMIMTFVLVFVASVGIITTNKIVRSSELRSIFR